MLIGVTGAKGSGKDTFARYFVERGFVNIKMAGPLKSMLSDLFLWGGYRVEQIERMLEGDLKEVPCDLLGGKTPRHAMQTLGTEWRDMIDKNLWTRLWLLKTTDCMKRGQAVICTDVRFHHEAENIRKMGGRVIRIRRPGDLNNDPHPSEREMWEIFPDAVIWNDGPISELEAKAKYLLGSMTQ